METVGQRIRARIAPAGMASQRDLAGRIGMKPDALSRALSGERGLSIAELIAMSNELGVSLHWLATGAEDPNQLSVAARHGYDHVSRSRIVVDWDASRPVLENIAIAYEQVNDRLPVRINAEVPTAAKEVRAALVSVAGDAFARNLADSVEAAFPVDVVRAAEVEGGFTVSVGRRTIIAINDTSNWFHQNFSLAHELGHVAARSMASIDAPLSDVDRVERAANAFGAEVLLPAHDMRERQWDQMTRPEVAAFIWQAGVSTKALASRLDALHLEVGSLTWELRSQSTQKFLRDNLKDAEGNANALVSKRMQEASNRRFPIALLTAHRDAIEDGQLHARTLAWMLDDDAAAIENELRSAAQDGDPVDDLAAFLGLGV